MANEFVARKGLIVSGSTQITGSLSVSGGITGSIVSASYAETSSIGLVAKAVDIISGSIGATSTSYTGSFTGSFSGSLLVIGDQTISGSLSVNGTSTFQQILEKNQTTGSAATGSINFDVLDQGVIYYTGNATANWLLNFRGNSTTTLNSIMYIGQSLSLAFVATNGSPAYYAVSHSIDGVTVTPKWSGGSAPTDGTTNSVEAYSYSIFKTADATFTVLASRTSFY